MVGKLKNTNWKNYNTNWRNAEWNTNSTNRLAGFRPQGHRNQWIDFLHLSWRQYLDLTWLRLVKGGWAGERQYDKKPNVDWKLIENVWISHFSCAATLGTLDKIQNRMKTVIRYIGRKTRYSWTWWTNVKNMLGCCCFNLALGVRPFGGINDIQLTTLDLVFLAVCKTRKQNFSNNLR